MAFCISSTCGTNSLSEYNKFTTTYNDCCLEYGTSLRYREICLPSIQCAFRRSQIVSDGVILPQAYLTHDMKMQVLGVKTCA